MDLGQEVKVNNVGIPKTKEELRAEFEELSRPLIKWMNENYHPHISAIITPVNTELVEGLMGIPIDDYILD